jgi:phosphatidylglycerol:prolipoprotein diacylglycerol transferase
MILAMYPVLLQFGPITIYSYGVMMALGFIAAGWTLGLELQRRGHDPNLASTFVLWAAVGGLLGARLLFIGEEWRAFLSDPWPLLFTGAGFVWYGGLLGGIVGVSLCIYKHGRSWSEMMDAVAPSIALGHGIGRLGCHFAGDGDWGPPTTLPWGVAYTNAIVGWDFPPGVRVHPTPIYETTAYLLVFAFLWSRRTKAPVPGTQLGWYLVLASTARFFLEFVRVNPPVLLGLSEAQLLSIFLVAAGAWLVLRGRETPLTAQAATPSLTRGKRK